MLRTFVMAALMACGAVPAAAQVPDSIATPVSPRTRPTATIPT